MINLSDTQNKYLWWVFLVVIVFLSLQFPYLTHGGAGDNLSGWAWSETIGWISFNSENQGTGADYGVNVAVGGAMSGYAWSENIGWISFNAADVVGCQTAPCAPTLNQSTGVVDGWARACAGTINGDCTGGSRTDGWDGWIHLRGTATDSSEYGVTVSNCNWDGWAWGGDVVGWIHFRNNSVPYGVVGTGDACAISILADIKANTPGNPPSDGPITIPFNTSATLTWTSIGADSCDVSPGGWSGLTGSQLTGNLTSNQTYTLTCLKIGLPNATDQVIVNQTCGNGTIDPGEDCDGADLGGATCQSVGALGGTLSCTAGCTYDVTQCVFPPPAVCEDGSDNDGDGLIDYGTNPTNDPGCTSANDGDERNQCLDLIDNDGDGKTDTADPGCHLDGNPANASSYAPQGNLESNQIFQEI